MFTGSWESGVYDYNVLPFAGATVHNDLGNISSYSYDPAKKELISYDTPIIIETKCNWMARQELAGGLY